MQAYFFWALRVVIITTQLDSSKRLDRDIWIQKLSIWLKNLKKGFLTDINSLSSILSEKRWFYKSKNQHAFCDEFFFIDYILGYQSQLRKGYNIQKREIKKSVRTLLRQEEGGHLQW